MIHAQLSPELTALLPGYLHRRDQDARDLESLLFERDYDAIAAIGHKLKGNGTAFGFARISASGAEIERTAKTHDLDRLTLAIQEFQEILMEIRRDG